MELSREIDPASPIWITPTVLGSCLAIVLAHALYTYKKELPLPPGPPGIGPGIGPAMAPAPRPVDATPDTRVYFFFTKVNYAYADILKPFTWTPAVWHNLGIALVLLLIIALAATEVTYLSMHVLKKSLTSMENTGSQVASALALCLLLAVLYYRLRDSALSSILYVLALAFIMVLGALISSQTQVNVQ